MSALLLALFMFQLIYGCTHFRVIAKDKSVIIGRSMEFDTYLGEYFQSDPKGTQYKMYLPPMLCKGKEGFWDSKYDLLNALAKMVEWWYEFARFISGNIILTRYSLSKFDKI